ncbi:hypothetical protein RhiirA5_424689 [Rhizophagus irregularis]|uniref:Uncharacterized protein n=5 Tax=Rhizophagus irregularis TaxID=588596 RepID=A0A2I1GTW8_9GLOM|nr:hypothetical protein GLOIN_2v1840994 [Rhizophagus irregularis DAOM 181602=DAOM 197198]PKC02816.1 hypothetical protein RhiirA5_424689 [Rhizophagus irregularis]PKC59907.1 hypothetical protein RhiirA1_540192 [Rhizophagus irregularis]PKK67371.1 hypothetical protein RhiirC2_852190 [Rhizophagus irregularis]PKY17383.1 hypothetical protein RhiirB3_429998 [Rhizophagus irregularis]PKY50098.1 hypothetical protein RhiirA4_466393 [Rhizophagus irregularis]|eukprot:XP_025178414.1 hypothetical protein GLOIN_2v1840994 [Rhizophagus irregularis DAOM 181602=DAOM 197198]
MKTTFLSNLIHFPIMMTSALLNSLNIRTHSTQITPLETTKRQTARVQFRKSNRKKEEFIGTLTFISSNTKDSTVTKTVAYGQWFNIHDTNPLNYEFVIYKNGEILKDLTVNIQRNLSINKNGAKLLTTFDELELDGSQNIIGGCIYISNQGRVISKAEICKI